MSDQTLVCVTAEHIEYGVAGDCRRCPIAVALLDAIGNAGKVGVTENVITVWLPGAMWQADTPPVVAAFIRDFDNYDPVAPIGFTLTWRVEVDPEGMP